jgi:hypothetical protein
MLNLIPLPGFAISERDAMALGELDTLCDLLLRRYGSEPEPAARVESDHAVPAQAR